MGRNASTSGSQTYTASVPGTITLTPVVSGATNASIGGAATAGTLATATVNVFSGNGVWTGTSGSPWSTAGNWTDANGVQAAPGTFAGFTNTDAATFSGSGSVTSISLNGANPSLAALNLSGSNYSLSDGTLTFSSTGLAKVTASGTQSISSLLNLAASTDMVVTSSSDVLRSPARSPAAIRSVKDGNGTLILSGSDTYSGGTSVDAGTLEVLSASALPKGTSLTVGAAAHFRFDPSVTGVPGVISSPAGTVVAAVPEPGTLVLLLAALGIAVIYQQTKKRR